MTQNFPLLTYLLTFEKKNIMDDKQTTPHNVPVQTIDSFVVNSFFFEPPCKEIHLYFILYYIIIISFFICAET